jgi:hypothetical protein
MGVVWAIARDEAFRGRLVAHVEQLPASMFPDGTRDGAWARLAEYDDRISELAQERFEAEKAAAIAEIEASFADA